MSDLKRTGLNNQKRGVCVAVLPFVEADILLTGSIYASLPSYVVVQAVNFLFTTVSGTVTPDISVTINGTAVVTNVDCGSVSGVGLIRGTPAKTASYFASGGDVVILAGTTTPADGALVGSLIVEYVELDKVTGEYTD